MNCKLYYKWYRQTTRLDSVELSNVHSIALLTPVTLVWHTIFLSSKIVVELISLDELSGASFPSLLFICWYILWHHSSVSRLSIMYIQGSTIELVIANLTTRSSVGPLVSIDRFACCIIFIWKRKILLNQCIYVQSYIIVSNSCINLI